MYVFINKKSYKQWEKHWKNGRYIGLRGELTIKFLILVKLNTSDTYNAFAANESLKTKTLAFIVMAG